MRYLVDADVLSEPTKPAPRLSVVDWLRKNEGDSLIAATALVHGLVIATRNRADFEKAGLKIVDPFAA